MRVLVTGCAGFIGYRLCKRLLSEGHEVLGIDNLNDDYHPSMKERRTLDLESFPKYDFVKLDIVNDAFASIFGKKTVDYVVHLAAKDIYYESADVIKYAPYLVTNVIGTAKIFELSKHLKAKKFIFASTFSVYGKTKKSVLTEKKILPQPISPHGASKIAAEQVVHFMSNFYDLPAVILRIFSTYGPDMRAHTLIPLLIDRINENETIDLYSGDTTRDYVYIDDVVEAIMSSFNKRLKFQAINIGSGQSASITQIAAKIAVILGKDPKHLKYSKNDKDFSKIVPSDVRINIDRAKKLLNYSPKTSIDDGLKKTVEWYLRNPEILKKSAH